MKTKNMKIVIAVLVAIALIGGAVALPLVGYAEGQGVLLEVEYETRNLTQQRFDWSGSINARPGDRLEFRAALYSSGIETAQGVLVRASLPDQMAYAGNLRIDGELVEGDVVAQSIPVGDIPAETFAVVTFEAVVDPAMSFLQSTTALTSTAIAYSGQAAISDSATVHVARDGVPTGIPTAGGLSPAMFALMATLGILFVATYVYFARYYFTNHILRSAYETKTDRKLAEMIERARRRP